MIFPEAHCMHEDSSGTTSKQIALLKKCTVKVNKRQHSRCSGLAIQFCINDRECFLKWPGLVKADLIPNTVAFCFYQSHNPSSKKFWTCTQYKYISLPINDR